VQKTTGIEVLFYWSSTHPVCLRFVARFLHAQNAIVRGVWQNGGDLGDLTQKPAENALF
jgi:hypothetical protein